MHWKPGSKFISNKTECSTNIDHKSTRLRCLNELTSESPCATEESSIIMFNAFDASVSETENCKESEVLLKTRVFINEKLCDHEPKVRSEMIAIKKNKDVNKEGLSKLRESMKEIDMKLQSIQEIYPTSNSKRLTLEYINTKKLVEPESPSQFQNEDEECNVESSITNANYFENPR